MYNCYIPAGQTEPTPSGQNGTGEQNKNGGQGGLGGMLHHLFEGGIPKPDRLLQALHLDRFDSGDILLMLVLVYLFIESDDEDWLIVLALVVLLGF